MKSVLVLTALLFAGSAFAKVETRCGWISNPTPANYWITDADGTWIMAVQGGYQAEGLDENLVYPDDSEYVQTNGSYGYFCGCIKADTDKKNMQINKIISSKAQLLKTCLEDVNLPAAQ